MADSSHPENEKLLYFLSYHMVSPKLLLCITGQQREHLLWVEVWGCEEMLSASPEESCLPSVELPL